MEKRLTVLAVLLLLPVIVAAQEVHTFYKDGIVVKSDDGNFLLKFNARMQHLFAVEDRDLGNASQTTPSFNIRRARMTMSGNGFYPWLKYEMQFTLEGAALNVRDLWLDLAKNRKLQPRLGQFKVPFNREFLTSTGALQCVDRSIVNEEFQLGRDIGFALRGHLSSDKVEYALGAFNGSAQNRANQDRTLMYVARAGLNLLGKMAYSQAALENPGKPLLAIGVAAAILPNYKPAIEGSGDRANLARAVRGENSDTSDVIQVTADVALKSRGFSFEGEYHFRRLKPIETSQNVNANGLRLQAGYFVVPQKIEIALLFAKVNPNTAIKADAAREMTPAFSYYASGHRLKLQTDFSFIKEEQPVDAGGNLKHRRFRAQMQFLF